MCDTTKCKSNKKCNSCNSYTSQKAVPNNILNSYAKCAQKGYGGGINKIDIHIDKKLQVTTLQISNKIVKGKDGNVKNIQAPLINSINYKIPYKEDCGPLCGRICPCDSNTRGLKIKKMKQKNRVETDACWRTGGQLDCRKKQPRKNVCKDKSKQLRQKWKDAKCGTFKETGYAIAYGNERFIAGGRNISDTDTSIDTKTIKYSDDGGITWKNTLSGNFNARCFGLVYANGIWVACGENIGDVPPTIKYSTDNGLTWQNGTNTFDSGSAIGFAVAYGNGRWVAVGQNDNNITIKYSDDGINWIDSSPAFNIQGNDILYLGNQKWIAVGEGGGTIAISEDNGINWILDSPTGFDQVGYGIAKDDCGKLVAVGNSQNTILYSEDGGNVWLPSNSGEFSLIGFKVAYANGVWVAVGVDDPSQPKPHTIKYSLNGKNWLNTGCNEFTEKNDRFSGGFGVAYGCENWVTVGKNNPINSKTIKYVEPIEEPINYGGGAFYNYTVTRGNKISNTRNVDYTARLKISSLNGKNCIGVIKSTQKNKKNKFDKNNCLNGCEHFKPTPTKSFNLTISKNKNLNFLGSSKTF